MIKFDSVIFSQKLIAYYTSSVAKFTHTVERSVVQDFNYASVIKNEKQQFMFYLFINFCRQRIVKFLNLSSIFQFLSKRTNRINEIFQFPCFLKQIWSEFFCFLSFPFHCLKQTNFINLLLISFQVVNHIQTLAIKTLWVN